MSLRRTGEFFCSLLTHQIKQIVWELFIKRKTAPERRFHRRRNFIFYVDTINIKWESGKRVVLKLKLCQHLFAFSWLAHYSLKSMGDRRWLEVKILIIIWKWVRKKWIFSFSEIEVKFVVKMWWISTEVLVNF